MKNTFRRLIVFGFIINILVVLALGSIYIFRITKERQFKFDQVLDWSALSLFVLSFILLTVVFQLILSQTNARNVSEQLLLDNKKLLLSIIDNTTNPISIKKINGEYLLVNKQFEQLFHITAQEVKGKTDHDFLEKEIADAYRNTDLEVVKAGKEMKFEETISQPDGLHTYIAVKFPLYDITGRIYAIGGISTDITERKDTEKSLKAGETFFNMSMDSLIISSNDTFVKVNPATLQTLGYLESELLNKPFMTFIHPEDIEKTKQEVVKLESGAVTVNFENRFLCKDGSYKWLNWTTFPDKNTGLLYCVARDVTAQKNYQESLRAGDNFFNMAWEILVISTKEKFIKVNPALIRVLGYTELELVSRPFISFVFPGDVEETKKELEAIHNGTSSINVKSRWVCKNQEIKWLSWTATIDPATKLLYMVAQDITEKIKLENEQQEAINQLYENEQKLRLILENISDGVIVADINKNVLMANDMANTLFGVEEDEKMTADFSSYYELYLPDEKTVFPSQNLPIDRALKGDATDDIDVVFWNPEAQEKKRMLLSGRPIVDQKKEVIAAVITIKDITKYKQLEEELKETEMKYRRLIGFKKNEE